jgi:hypothetical protein
MEKNDSPLERAVERLEADMTACGKSWLVAVHKADLRLILAANRKMREALEPFAACADTYEDFTPDEAFTDSTDGLTVGECRKARSVLSTKETT